jgi:hypothetical protein
LKKLLLNFYYSKNICLYLYLEKLEKKMASILFASKLAVKVTSSMFASNSLYCSVIEHPARMSLSTPMGHAQWRAGFLKVAVLQSTLALAGAGFAIVSNYYAPDRKMLTIAALLFSMIPYTAIFMMETNTYLLDSKCDSDSEKTRDLLDYWGALHSVRTVIGLTAMGLALYFY